METIYLLECIAPPALHVDRFPPRRCACWWIIGATMREVPSGGTSHPATGRMAKATLLEQPEFRDELLPNLIEKAEAIARQQMLESSPKLAKT